MVNNRAEIAQHCGLPTRLLEGHSGTSSQNGVKEALLGSLVSRLTPGSTPPPKMGTYYSNCPGHPGPGCSEEFRWAPPLLPLNRTADRLRVLGGNLLAREQLIQGLAQIMAADVVRLHAVVVNAAVVDDGTGSINDEDFGRH